MSTGLIIVIVVAAVVVFWGYSLYVTLIKRRNNAREALSVIDVQLRKRHDLVPNVLALAKKFMEHEKGLLEEVTALRTKATAPYNEADPQAVKQHLAAESQLSGAFGKLMVNMEAYPDLKSDSTMLEAQNTYRDVEANIAAARRFYNSAVKELNNAVEIFPGSLVAGLVNVQAMPFFEETDEAVRAPVSAADHL